MDSDQLHAVSDLEVGEVGGGEDVCLQRDGRNRRTGREEERSQSETLGEQEAAASDARRRCRQELVSSFISAVFGASLLVFGEAHQELYLDLARSKTQNLCLLRSEGWSCRGNFQRSKFHYRAKSVNLSLWQAGCLSARV